MKIEFYFIYRKDSVLLLDIKTLNEIMLYEINNEMKIN